MRAAVNKVGAVIGQCPGCGSNPVRSHPTIETLCVVSNWTRTCPRCRRKMCIVCFPVGRDWCVRGDCESMDEVLGMVAA